MLKVHILDKSTGERAIYPYDFPWEDGSDYLWADGNYSCDCNRSLFFNRALGCEERPDVECGDGRFVIEKIVETETGKVVYFEDDKEKTVDSNLVKFLPLTIPKPSVG